MATEIMLNLTSINLIWRGGGEGPESSRSCTFSTKHPEGLQKVGVMGYVNLSYYIGNTPKMVYSPKKFVARSRGPRSWAGGKFWSLEIWIFFIFG